MQSNLKQLLIIIVTATLVSCSGNQEAPDSGRPNIIIILADDMGYSDIGCYGSEIRTPNIDRIADEGIRFTQFYNASRCCPTRASLLTGLHPHQAGVGHMTRDYGMPQYPSYDGDLNRSSVTIAEALKLNGYKTMLSGKWHVTKHTGLWDGSKFDSKENWPLQRGFDKFYGIIQGSSSFFDPVLVKDNDPVKPEGDNYYLTDAIADNAVEFLDNLDINNDNFFLYLSFNAPHWPLHALPEDIEKYKARYNQGWDVLREERYKKMIELGIIDEDVLLPPRSPESYSWTDEENKEWQARRMAVYAAMVDRMDQNIGKVLKKLQELGTYDNTLIFFLSDNGGSPETVSNPRKFSVPLVTKFGKEVHRGTKTNIMPGADTTFMGYGIHWAAASNTPFRLFKRWTHEGGIATPLIIHWPQNIKNPGKLTNQTGHIIDIMATCLDASGTAYPEMYNGNKITSLEGKSLLPVLKGELREEHEFLAWQHEGNRAIRKGNWKMVSYYSEPRQRKVSKGERSGEWELYNLKNDRNELLNLAKDNPEKIAELTGLYEQWSRRVGVVPWEEFTKKNAAAIKKAEDTK